MDFSGFNAAEQAHMTKVIEKKQVRMLSLPPRFVWQRFQLQSTRCKTLCECIRPFLSAVSRHVAMTLPAKLCRRKR
jgi:hypothetical protein